MGLPNGRTVLGELFWLPWSATAWVLSILWLCFWGSVFVLAVLFVPFERWQHRIGHQLTSVPMWLALGPMKVTEDPRYRRDIVSMFMQNHVTQMGHAIRSRGLPIRAGVTKALIETL